jgi:hypothetical protein
MEEFPYAAVVRDKYPSYREAKASMQADWDAFLEKMPHFIEPYEREREGCAYKYLVASACTHTTDGQTADF